jgi:hypothetical protein
MIALVVLDLFMAYIGVTYYGGFFVVTTVILTPFIIGGWLLVRGGSPFGRTVRRVSDGWRVRRGRPHEAWDE